MIETFANSKLMQSIAKFDANIESFTISQLQSTKEKNLLTAVGFEPTPFLTGA